MTRDVGFFPCDIEFEHEGRTWGRVRIAAVEVEKHCSSVGDGIRGKFHKAYLVSFGEASDRIVFGSYLRQTLFLCLTMVYSAYHGGLTKRFNLSL